MKPLAGRQGRRQQFVVARAISRTGKDGSREVSQAERRRRRGRDRAPPRTAGGRGSARQLLCRDADVLVGPEWLKEIDRRDVPSFDSALERHGIKSFGTFFDQGQRVRRHRQIRGQSGEGQPKLGSTPPQSITDVPINRIRSWERDGRHVMTRSIVQSRDHPVQNSRDRGGLVMDRIEDAAAENCHDVIGSDITSTAARHETSKHLERTLIAVRKHV